MYWFQLLNVNFELARSARIKEKDKTKENLEYNVAFDVSNDVTLYSSNLSG